MEKEKTTDQWREEKKKKKAQMSAMQALPYDVKVKSAKQIAREYIERQDDMRLNAQESVG